MKTRRAENETPYDCPAKIHTRAQRERVIRGARWRMICTSCRGAFVYWTSPPPQEYSPGLLTEVQVDFPFQIGLTRKVWSGTPTIDELPGSYSAN